ncbi:MAG: DUF6701 domain-containing protein [Pseudomonadota bacterium]
MKPVLLALYALLLAFAAPARADTGMYLFKSFTGNVNFAGTQVTIRDRSKNASPCRIYGEGVTHSASLNMPDGATVVSAHLYWAGSGSADTGVTMNGKPVSANSDRVYTSATIGGGFNYFSAAAEVTDLVKLKGSGSYTFSGLRVANGNPWCDRSAVLGGYALVVIYSQKDETYRTLNLYEGFRAMLNSEVRLDMANFRVPDNVSSSSVGRFGHLVWEGDSDIAQQGESLTFYNFTLTQSTYGPSGNNFNSKSSINGDTSSLGIDFDAYSMTGWPAKLNSVSALFRTGGDLVMLNAALLAVPNTPAADLQVELVRTTDLRVNSTATYTATVTNLGPGTEMGPFSVSFTLPSGMSYSSGSGTNWKCTGSGTTANCTYSGQLAKGARAVLTLNAVVSKTGTMTTSVTVTGNNDPDTANNKDSDTASVATSAGLSFDYTRRACVAGELVGPGAACPTFTGPVIAGTTTSIFLTAVDSNNRARTLSNTQRTDVALSAALGCVNPSVNAGVKATFYDIALPVCEKDSAVPTSTTAWINGSVPFEARQVSLPIPFRYADVGSVKLYIRSGNVTDYVQFVSIPERLQLTVRNAQKLAPNPGNLLLGANGFVRAGEPFTISVTALSSANASGVRVILPNFGNETGTLRPAPEHVLARLDTPKDVPAAELVGSYPASGAFTGSFSWSDIGSFSLGATLESYLGVELAEYLPGGKQAESALVNVGRFYPASFATTAGPGFDCLPRMGCPTVGLAKVNGAAYSRQPFKATIAALDENGSTLRNFDNTILPALIPKITLAAVNQPGTGAAFVAANERGFTNTAAATMSRDVRFSLGPLFNLGAPFTTTPASNGRLAPTAVYLRATAPDVRAGINPATNAVVSANVAISSVQSEVAESEEGGIMVISGRLAVSNAMGSELLKTPIPMNTQYWTGASWENNSSFKADSLLSSSQAKFSSCQNTLSLRGTVGVNNCNTQLVKPASTTTLEVSTGSARFTLAPVGAGQFGNFRMWMDTKAAAEWLPSTYGQITIGAYRSPVIYIREVY